MGELIATIAKWMTANEDCIALIVDILGAIATVAAVVVALFANRNANKQLKAALQIQEQSKNVDLFDRRVELVQQIEHDELIYKPALVALFTSDIVSIFDAMQNTLTARKTAEHDLKVYYDKTRTADGEGGFVSIKEEIEDRLSELTRHNFSVDMEQEFVDFCNSKSIYYSETTQDEDYKKYNYIEIQDRIDTFQTKYESQKRILLEAMHDFISKSIKPLDAKGGKKKI